MAPKRARPSSPVDPSTDGVILYKPEHRENYQRLASNAIIDTAYLDDKMLDTLGLRAGVEYMADQIGWTRFLTMKEPAYRSLTFEFLSTLEFVGANEDHITFRLGNQGRELTLAQLDGIFGFRTGGWRKNLVPRGFCPMRFWDEIADCSGYSSYDARNSRAAEIYNPCIRLLHRVVALTIFGRHLPAYTIVRNDELIFLWGMLDRGDVDTGYFLLNHMKKVSSKGNPNVIFVGGIITAIARYLNVELDGLKPMDINWINIESCVKDIDMIFERNGRYYLRVLNSTRRWPFPDVAYTTLRNQDNWKSFFQADLNDDANDDDDHTAADEVELDHGDSFGSIAASTPGSILRSLSERVEKIERQLPRLHSIESMMQQMYNWQVRQGHFPF